jgi:hypothetical protein
LEAKCPKASRADARRNDEHYVAGDTGMSKWTLRGTVAATGQRIEVRGCDFFEFRGGKVLKKDSYWKLVEPAPSGRKS